jgi:hypothetical protein
VRALERDAGSVIIPLPQPVRSANAVKRQSRQHYGRPRVEVERYITRVLGY